MSISFRKLIVPYKFIICIHTYIYIDRYTYIHTFISAFYLYRPRNKVGSIMAAGGVLRPGQERELTTKEKRLLKILSEELVDPDNLTGSGGGGKKRPPSSRLPNITS